MPIPFRIREVHLSDGPAWVPAHPEVAHLASFRETPPPPIEEIRLSLFSAVDMHHPGEYSLEFPLEERKQQIFAQIDARSRQLFVDGFTFEGITFSLSLEAQARYTGILVASAMLTFPIAINSLDDNNVLTLTQDLLIPFVGAALARVKAIVDGGTEQKDVIRNASTTEELAAYVDPR